MPDLTRRSFLGACSLGALAGSVAPSVAGAAPLFSARVPAPAILTRLPGDGNALALTVDDGCSSADVAALGRFCADTGMRLTFFVNGKNPSWTDNAALLQPMVATGQIQLGNHTWSHPDITTLSPTALADQVERNAEFLHQTYGVDGTPYFRPPYGRHNSAADRVVAAHGYGTIALWSAEIGDSTHSPESTPRSTQTCAGCRGIATSATDPAPR